MRSIWQDVRYALRQMRKSPAYALTAIAVLALGLGANIAVFSLLNGILLRPMPYAQPGQLVSVSLLGPLPYYDMSYANMRQLQDALGPRFKTGEMFGTTTASVVGPGGRVQLVQARVGPRLMGLLGIQPALGRIFRVDEFQPGGERVVLLGDDVWRRLFNADPAVVGKSLTIRGVVYSIAGVMPRGFSFPFGDEMQIWSPQPLTAANGTAMDGDAAVSGELLARVPEGITIEELSANLNRIQPVIAREVANSDVPSGVRVMNYQRSKNEQARKPLTLLYAVVFGLWALACLNVTSLMLARAVSRMREQAVRSALGASRARLLQQSIVESLLLSAMGAIAGLLLGQSAIKLLWRQIERHLPLTNTIHVDWRVIACLGTLTLLTAAIVGVFPALRASRRTVSGSLHGVTSTASASQNRTREALVVGQLALTMVFLVGAGLFLRTIYALRQVPLGFTQQNVLTGGVILHAGQMQMDDSSGPGPGIIHTAYLPLLERLRAIPGVQVAALSSVLPMRSEFAVKVATVLDHKKLPTGQTPDADGRIASDGLVDAFGIPMVRGRFFNQDDTASSPVVAVVNDAFVKKYQAKYGSAPRSGHSLANYMGALVFLDAMAAAPDLKADSIRTAVMKVDIPVGATATGWGVKFSEAGQNTRATPFLMQWQGGELVTVFPADAAVTKMKTGIGAN